MVGGRVHCAVLCCAVLCCVVCLLRMLCVCAMCLCLVSMLCVCAMSCVFSEYAVCLCDELCVY